MQHGRQDANGADLFSEKSWRHFEGRLINSINLIVRLEGSETVEEIAFKRRESKLRRRLGKNEIKYKIKYA